MAELALDTGEAQPVSLFGHDISGKGPKTYTGLNKDASGQLLNAIMPTMSDSILNMNQNINKGTNDAVGLYNRTAKNQLKQVLPSLLDGLSARGILNSTMGENALSSAMADIINNAAGKSYEAGIANTNMKTQIPATLSTPLSQTRFSESSNDLAPFELLMNGVQSLM